ncbi:MAG: HD domain-containing phosphohydrolase [Anaerolineales bacterium]
MRDSNLIPFIIKLLQMRDPYANGHSDHVCVLACLLGKEFGLSAEQLANLEFAAKIHDIGKVAISDYVLNKPGRYTETEYLTIQQHTLLGSKLIETLGLDPIIHLTILNHHENYDGTGYPHKIKGDAIPIEARILRIADTYDALTSPRGYRPAYMPEQATAIMKHEEGFYDPKLLELFFQLKPENIK